MNKLFKSLKFVALIAVTLAIGFSVRPAPAALPTFKSIAGGGNATQGTQVIFPADANSQIRLISLFYSSDLGTGNISFNTGTTALTQSETNALTTTVTNRINTTNGLSPGAVIILQHAGVCYTNTVVTFNASTTVVPGGGTNVVLTAGGWGVLATAGDDIYVMSSAPTTIYVGAGTNALVSEAIYVANYGRPLQVYMSLATATNRILASAHYDSQSN